MALSTGLIDDLVSEALAAFVAKRDPYEAAHRAHRRDRSAVRPASSFGRPGDDSPPAPLVGATVVRAIGPMPRPSTPKQARRDRRNAVIWAARREGIPQQWIADAMGLSLAGVQKVLDGPEELPYQPHRRHRAG